MRPLSTIASIGLGATPGNVGHAEYLRLSNIEAGSIVGAPQRGSAPQKGLETRLRDADLVMRSRGPDLSAAWVGKRYSGLFATTDVFVIRPNVELVDPAYLAAFLSLPATQATLAADAQGSVNPRVTRPTLAQLEVPLPPLHRQRIIGQIAADGARERELIQQIAETSERLRQSLLRRAMEEAHTEDTSPRRGRTTGPSDAPTSPALPSAPNRKHS